MTETIERDLLNEIVKREKDLVTLKQAYEVLSGSKIVGIETIHVTVPDKPEEKVVSGTPEHSKKLSEAMTKSWARRKAGVPKGVEVRPVGKWAGLTKEQRSAEISKRMTAYWAKRREEKLNQRGLPTLIETHHQPVEDRPVFDDEPVPAVEKGVSHVSPEMGRLAFLPVGRVRKNRVWEKDEDKFLMDVWKSRTPAEIAKMLLRTVKNIEKRYVRLKEDQVVGKIMRKPKSKKGEKFMKSYRKSWDEGLTKTKQRWSPDEDDRLLHMARDGHTSRQISKELKRSVGSIIVRYRIKTGNSVIPADRKRSQRGESRRSSLSKLNVFRGG